MALAQYALCNGGNKIVNVCTWDGNNATWQPAAGITPRDITSFPNAEIGDTFDGTTLTKAPPSPRVVAEGNRAALIEKGKSALVANSTFLAIASPNNAQSLAQIQSLSKQVNALIRLIGNQLDSTTDT